MSEVAILLISEDGSKWAFETLEHLCCRVFDWLTPQVGWGAWLSFAPANTGARAAATANMWKSKNPRDYAKILRLCRAIAEQILREDGFVVFHIDGDVVWGEEQSSNVERFDEVIRSKVRDIVRGYLAQSGEVGELRLAAVMEKFILLAPYYSIEAWLFANVPLLRELGSSATILDDWESDLLLLDRSTKPKELLTISTRHYPRLARGLNTAALYELGSSFADAVHAAGACGDLLIRLRTHWPAWVRADYGLS